MPPTFLHAVHVKCKKAARTVYYVWEVKFGLYLSWRVPFSKNEKSALGASSYQIKDNACGVNLGAISNSMLKKKNLFIFFFILVVLVIWQTLQVNPLLWQNNFKVLKILNKLSY